jgi:hypothetical protein
MDRFHAALDSFLVVVACLLISVGWAAFSPQQQNVGVALPQGSAVFETSLQSRISTSDTSMTLVTNALRGSETLSGYNCFTIDEGRSDSEFVCGDVSGTTVSNLERGLSFSTGTTTVAALKFAHRVGANVKITDFPLIQRMRHQLSGTDTIVNILKYASHPTFTATTDIVDKKYVDDIAFSGAAVVDATTAARGVGEVANQAEAAASTATGGSGVLLLPASMSTSTWNLATAAQRLVMTGSSGLIDPNFLRLASSTHATTSVAFGWGTTPVLVPLSSPAATNTIMAFSGTSPYRASFVEEGWTLIESTTTASTMSTATTTAITAASLSSFRELKIFVQTTGTSVAGTFDINFNNDGGNNSNNYGYRSFLDYVQTGALADADAIVPVTNGTTSPLHFEITISNPTSARKMLHWLGEANSSAAVIPSVYSGAGVWNNSSNPITSIALKTSAGTFNSGMIISVFGKRN